jgi:hypothetical protein
MGNFSQDRPHLVVAVLGGDSITQVIDAPVWFDMNIQGVQLNFQFLQKMGSFQKKYLDIHQSVFPSGKYMICCESASKNSIKG